MNTRTRLIGLALAFALIGAAFTVAILAGTVPPRPQGPCDIYAAAGTPCVAAHGTTRALYASYDGPLYQVKRQSDGATLDIGVVRSVATPVPDAGGYANAAAQDAFCANTLCVITLIYDQSGKGNHLRQAPPGPSFPGPAKGGFDTQPIADMAPITLGGHKAYGVYIMPGMGFRNNDATDIAVNDEPEGIYDVIDGTHFDSGCCFDYGNSSTNGRAVGTGTMETTYFGTSTNWGRGSGLGPWVMADMEAGLFSGYDAKLNAASPTIDSWRFVTAVVNGGGGNRWELRGGNAQKDGLTTFYTGVRPGSLTNNAYYPMHKQGAILLGIGGDNGNGSAGTFYEGVMTTGCPAVATTDAVQANIVAASYDVARMTLSRVTTFTPGSTQELTATFTNTTGAPLSGVTLQLVVPAGWSAVGPGARGGASTTFGAPVSPGASVSAAFTITSPEATGAGYLTGKAEWRATVPGGPHAETRATRVRNVLPVKINEVRLTTGTSPTNQFIELYNASASPVDLSNWTLVNTQSQWAPIRLATIPAATKLAAGGFYLLGLSSSGLAAPATAGATTINVRTTSGFEIGQRIEIDGESRTIVRVGTAAAVTTVFAPVSTGPWITIPAGSVNLPVTNAAGFEVGQKVGIDAGGHYELATVTAVGKAATQTTLSAAAAAGATSIRIAAASNVTVGDTLTVGTGGRRERVTITNVAAAGANGTSVDLAAPLKFDHASGIDVSDPGTGIRFTPATRFLHVSGDAVQALGSGIGVDRPLASGHPYGAAVINHAVTAEGYQGPPAPTQWFGGVLSARAGSIALLDATGAVVVDALVYGSQQSNSSGNGTIASPELATLEADQRQGGCIAVVPVAPRGPSAAAPASGATNRSLGRYPDGIDADNLCTDFQMQTATTLSAASAAGATNIKVAGVAGFAVGQTVLIDAGANHETAVIATVGTAGAAASSAATAAGATLIQVPSSAGFSVGQAITIDTGANQEKAVVAAVGRVLGPGGPGSPGGSGTITTAEPLKAAHAAGVQVAGTGITLSAPLTKAHASGTQVATSVPTPGAPNKYDQAGKSR